MLSNTCASPQQLTQGDRAHGHVFRRKVTWLNSPELVDKFTKGLKVRRCREILMGRGISKGCVWQDWVTMKQGPRQKSGFWGLVQKCWAFKHAGDGFPGVENERKTKTQKTVDFADSLIENRSYCISACRIWKLNEFNLQPCCLRNWKMTVKLSLL